MAHMAYMAYVPYVAPTRSKKFHAHTYPMNQAEM